jgi:hypothetical protein
MGLSLWILHFSFLFWRLSFSAAEPMGTACPDTASLSSSFRAESMTLTSRAGRGAFVACLVAAIGGLLACLALPATAQSCPVPGLSLYSYF